MYGCDLGMLHGFLFGVWELLWGVLWELLSGVDELGMRLQELGSMCGKVHVVVGEVRGRSH